MDEGSIPTYAELDELVDTDPIKLRDVAWDLARRLQALQDENS